MSIKIVTHNGHYHSDDIFAVAVLSLYLKEEENEIEVIRTRDEEVIEKADFAVDVGGSHDPENGLFDHHQEEGVGARDNGVPYAAFGLVWKYYGVDLAGGQEEAETVDRKLVQPIDSEDNGVKVSQNVFEDISPYTVQDFFFAFLPTWREADAVDVDKVFMNCVDIAKSVLKREIVKAKDEKYGKEMVKKSLNEYSGEKVVVLDDYYPWKDAAVEHSDLLFMIYPSSQGDSWHVQGVPSERGSMDTRLSFPEEWRGKRESEIPDVTGVEDALFCHKAGFLAVARSKEGALDLAYKALENNE
ncbi:MAG: MYG1 family protein [Patescibacteria group bacterium]